MIDYVQDRKVKTEEEKIMLAMFYYSFYNSNPQKEGMLTIEGGVGNILEILKYNYETTQSIVSQECNTAKRYINYWHIKEK